MTDHRTFVIIGAGLAGAKVVETLREEGFDGRVVLIGDEPEPPYERPPLSKGLLLRTADRESTYLHEPAWYEAHDIDLRTGCAAVAVDRERRQVRLVDGEQVGYDRLLFATGAAPRTLPVPGIDLDGVLRLRTLADSGRLAATLDEGARLVVVGAGWIGLEVAAAARARGVTVTVVETDRLPLRRTLGDRLAGVFADLHREHDVRFHFGTGVRELRGTGRVSRVVLDDGTEVAADAVLVAIGVTPNSELAGLAGVRVGNGILVDHSLRTDDRHIFAAGDVAAIDHPVLGARIRVEHWANALHTGPLAARAMLGHDVSYDVLPYFYTDQYELGMEYHGWVAPGGDTDLVIRGDVDSREFVALWTTGGRVVAGMNVNVWDVGDAVQDLIRAGFAGHAVDLARLADPAVALSDLAPTPSGAVT